MTHLRSTACIMKDASSSLRGLPVQVWKKTRKYIEGILVQKLDILNGLHCNTSTELKNNRTQFICIMNITLVQFVRK